MYKAVHRKQIADLGLLGHWFAPCVKQNEIEYCDCHFLKFLNFSLANFCRSVYIIYSSVSEMAQRFSTAEALNYMHVDGNRDLELFLRMMKVLAEE